MAKASDPDGSNRAGRVDMILSQLESLPTLPAVAVRLVQLTTDKHVNARQVVRLIESDPALTAKVLKMARRADSGIRSDAARTVERAVVMLGFDAIRNGVLSIKVFEAFGPGQSRSDPDSFSRQEFWKHSLGVGCAARLLAPLLVPRLDPEEAFVCGLLHDLGKVALDAILPKSYLRVAEVARAERAAISEIENRLLGVDHTVAGKRLAMRWGLPESIVSAIWLHHQDPQMPPRTVPGQEYARLVYLADLVVREHRIGFSGNPVFVHTAKDLARQMGIAELDYDQALHRLGEDIEQRAEVLGLHKVTRNALYLKALGEANSELGRLNEQLDITSRRLQRRSRYLDAFFRLNERLGQSHDLASLCGACAQALCEALEASSGAVLAVDRGGIIAIGSLADNRIRGTWARIEPRGAAPFAGPVSAHFQARSIPADDPLLATCEEHLAQGPAWMVDLEHAGDWHCAAILIATERQVSQWSAEAAELDALRNCLRLPLRQAILSRQAQDLAESLAEQARRLHETEPLRLHRRSLDIIAEMAAGAGHEMNTPLAVIAGRAQLLRSRVQDPQDARTIDTIMRQAHRCSEIVTELMDFARPPSARPARLALGPLVARILQDFRERNHLAAGQVQTSLPGDLPAAFFDEGHLAMILQEILNNGLQAAGEDPSDLRVNCRAEASDEFVVLSISDNGPGMSADVLAKALLPFFSHRPAGRGRGLGLSRAYRLAELNGGDLWLESLPGEGTTVYMRLPIAAAQGSQELAEDRPS